MSLDTLSRTEEDGPVTGAAPRLFKRAFDILAGQIAAGTIAGGTRLRESDVAARFGISRSPARRALTELHKLGLIEKTAGRGYRVKGRAKAPAPATGLPALDIGQHGHLTSRPSWERISYDVENEIGARLCFGSWRVNEAHLARHFGVSRTVARDVLARLQQRGLVRKDDRSRWYAPEMTPENIIELYELRGALEPLALRKAAPNMDPCALETARANLIAAMNDPSSATSATLDALEEELHVGLLRYSRSDVLLQAIAQPQSLLVTHRFLYRWTPHLFDAEPFLPEHLLVIDELMAGRTGNACEALVEHLHLSGARATRRVEFVLREFFPDALSYLEPLA